MFSHCCNEPSLDEVFGDFAVQLLMRRDGVTESDIRELLCKVKLACAGGLGATERRFGPTANVVRACDRSEIALRARTVRLREPGKIPLRFI
jgi:hypothetical protein